MTSPPPTGQIAGPVSGTTPVPSAPIPAPAGGSGSGDSVLPFVLLPVAAVGGVGLFILARRRRDKKQPRETGESPIGPVGPLPVPEPPLGPRPAPTGEEHVPRWRRPSVTAARFEAANTVAIRTLAATAAPRARVPAVFTQAIGDDIERMLVRYDGVPLLDRPDEVLGRARQELDTGDEVAVLERDEAWANVTTPSGFAGWVPSMALAAANTRSSEAAEERIAPHPEPPFTADERPALETLLETIAAERRARAEAGTSPGQPSERGSGRPAEDRPQAHARPRRYRKNRSASRPE